MKSKAFALVALIIITQPFLSTGCRKAESPAAQPDAVSRASDHLWPFVKAKAQAALLGADAIHLKNLKAKDSQVRLQALQALSRRRDAPNVVLSALVEALHDPDVLIRREAAKQLGRWGQTAKAAVPALVKAINDPDVSMRAFSVEALGLIKAGPALVVPALIRLLGDPSRGVRQKAALALGNYGGQAKSAEPALRKAAEDENQLVRDAAVEALNRLDAGLDTPLHLAAKAGRQEEIKALLAAGAKVNAKNPQGDTPLHLATKSRHAEIIELLLANQAEVNIKNYAGKTPLHLAILAENAPYATASTEQSGSVPMPGKAAPSKTNWEATVALLSGKAAAPETYSEAIVALLLAHRADVNAPDLAGCTPLHYAAWAGRADAVEQLLKQNAEVNAKTKTGDTALHLTRRKDVAKALLTARPEVNAKNDLGKTPLHRVVECLIPHSLMEKEYQEVMALLLAHQADANAQDKDGRTPLHAAAGLGNVNAVKQLLERWADANLKEYSNEWTPLRQALERYGLMPPEIKDRREVVALLLAHGADVNTKDRAGWTPLRTAVQLEDALDIVVLLLANKADVNAQDGAGQTPLIIAVSVGGKSAVEMLLAHNADVNVKDQLFGKTALQYAKNQVIAELLRQHGAKEDAAAAKRDKTAAVGTNIVAPAADTVLPFAQARQQAAAILGTDAGLLDKLKDSDPKTRRTALGALRNRGRDAPAIVLSAIVEALNDPDSSIRQQAASLLGSWGEPAKAATVALVKALDDPAPTVRQSAAQSLTVIKADPAVVVPALTNKLADPEYSVRQVTALALNNLGQDAQPAMPALIKALSDENEFVRNAAASTLKNLDPTALEKAEKQRIKSVRELVEMLGKPTTYADAEKAHKEAEEALRQRGTNALPELVRIAGSQKRDMAEAYVHQAFKILGSDAKPAIPMLIVLFKNPQTAGTARFCLEAIGQEAFPALTNALTNADKEIRANAIITLTSMDNAPDAVPTLIRNMKDDDGRVRWLAMNALGAIGAQGKQLDLIVPVFLKALHDPEYYEKYGPDRIRIPVAEALARIAGAGQQSDKILAVLLALVQDKAKGPAIRCAAIDALGKPPGQSMPAIQAPAVVKEVMSALLKTIKDPDAKVRTSSVRALGALGEKSDQTKAVTSVVMKMAEDPDSEVRASALTALCQLCKEPEKLLPMLLKSLKDKDPFVRVTAAGCLVGTTHAKEAQPVLLELVKNPGQGERRGVIRFSAMMALDRMGYDLPEKLRRDVAQEMQQEQADQAR